MNDDARAFFPAESDSDGELDCILGRYVDRMNDGETLTPEEILANSPIAIRCLKAALNADCDGQAGLQELAGCATMLYYTTKEAQEGKNAFLEKRKPDFSKFPRQP